MKTGGDTTWNNARDSAAFTSNIFQIGLIFHIRNTLDPGSICKNREVREHPVLAALYHTLARGGQDAENGDKETRRAGDKETMRPSN